MRKARIGILGLLLVLAATTRGNAMGTRDRDALTISGTIRAVGNAPYSMLVLTTEDGAGDKEDYLLTGPLEEELRLNQGKTVTLQGKECASPSPRFSRCFLPSRVVRK